MDENDEAARAVMRRHFHVDPRDINEYDMGFNTDRVSVAQCVDEIVKLSKSAQFAETEESRARLRDVAIAHHVRAALRGNPATADCNVRATSASGRVKLEGIVDRAAQKESCGAVANGVTGVKGVDNHLKVAEMPVRMRSDG